MQRVQKAVNWMIVVSELSHVFCCVLPTLFSLATFLVTFGTLSAMPVFMVDMHDILHAYEIPVILMSGVMLAMGWMLHGISVRIDCRNTGCAHEPCKPVKKRTSKVLTVASVVFAVNVLVYFSFHYGADAILANRVTDGHGHNHAH